MYFRRVYFIFLFILSGCGHSPTGLSPTVVITFPYNGAYVKDTIIIKAEVVDNVEIKKLEFYIDGELENEDTQSPYTYNWITIGLIGTHTILAKAYDNDDNYGLSNLVTVSIVDTTDIEPPQIAIVSPASWAQVSGTIEVLTEVSDNRGVASVLFLIDGDTVFADSTTPFNFLWDTRSVVNGPHTVLSKAFDTSNNWANYMITVVVQN